MIGSAEKDHSQAVVSPEEWRRAKDVLTVAAGLAGRERTRLVEARFPNEPRLRFELLSLLEVHDKIKHSLTPRQTAAFCRLEAPQAPTEPAAPAEQVIHIGRTCGPYRVLRLIGAGGMGQVYLAEDTRLGRRVALKSLAGSWLKSRTGRQRLLHEARTAAALSHPHIAPLYDVLEDENCFLLVMEYVEGRTAAALAAEGQLPIAQALRLMTQICEAVIYAHDRGIIHCDLKPSNIQVSTDGTAKVLDFGLARARYESYELEPEASSHQMFLVGTPAYMPPERFLKGSVDVSGDIYSLGVTLFEMTTGRLPFDERDFAALIGAIIGTPAPVVSSLAPGNPAGLDAVVARALSKDPSERYQTVREFCTDIQGVLNELEGAGSVTSAISEPAQQPVRAHARTLQVGAAVLAGLAGLALIGFITATVYCLPLGLTMSFEGESPLWWPVWGLRSLVLPLGQITLALLALGLMSQLTRAVLATIRPLRDRYERTIGTVKRWVDGVPLSTLAGILLIVNAVALALFLRRFQDLFESISSLLGNSGSLGAISPANVEEQKLYMRAFSLFIAGFGWSWYLLLKRKSRVHESISAGTLASAAAVMVLTFLFMTAPYRLFFQSKAERVSYESNVCYLVGKNGNDAMLFCPTQPPPWSRLVSLSDPGLKHTGTRESIFAAAGPGLQTNP
jgi:hypothetical protein